MSESDTEQNAVDPMYCPSCDERVPDEWDPIDERWRCPRCSSGLYEDKEAYIEVVHATARFNKEHGYGPWWDGDDDLVTDGGRSEGDTERWESQARENIDRWGNQTPTVLLLALVEEIAETADELLATADKSYENDMASQQAFHHLSEIRRAGFQCRTFLEHFYEDADGNPLPDEDVPQLVADLDEDRVKDELDDAAPLVYQLAWALEDGGRDD